MYINSDIAIPLIGIYFMVYLNAQKYAGMTAVVLFIVMGELCPSRILMFKS